MSQLTGAPIGEQMAAQRTLAECHDKMEEMGNTIELLHAELETLRAANAKLRDALLNIRAWDVLNDPEDGTPHFTKLIDKALSGEAIPVPDLEIRHEFAFCNSEGQFGDWQRCGIERFTELAGNEYCRRRIIRYVAQDWQLPKSEAVPVRQPIQELTEEQLMYVTRQTGLSEKTLQRYRAVIAADRKLNKSTAVEW